MKEPNNSDTAKLLGRSWKDGGLLIFNEKESKQIRASMEKYVMDIQKNHDMCAYQFKIGHDPVISPGCNISESPGIEPVLGIYGLVHAWVGQKLVISYIF